MDSTVGSVLNNMSEDTRKVEAGLVVGAHYTWGGDTGAYPYVIDKNDNSVYLHEEEQEKLYLETKSGDRIKYVSRLVTPNQKGAMTLKSLSPEIVFVCDEICCPGMLSAVEQGNISVIKTALSGYAHGEGQLSDAEAKLIYDQCIPWNTKNFINSAPAILDNIKNYIIESTREYEGSHNGYAHFKDARKYVYTVFWGANLGGVMDAIAEEGGMLQFREHKGWLQPFYDEKPINDLMQQLDKIITKANTGANQMVKDILIGANKKSAEVLASQENITTQVIADEKFAISIFQLWYANLYGNTKDIIKAVNLQLYEAAEQGDTTTLAMYGEAGLRKSMALIYGAMPKGGPKWLYEFYDFMYQCVTCEGWHYLCAHKYDYENLFQFLCNGYGEARPEWEQQLPELRKQLFDLGYKHSDRFYETRF